MLNFANEYINILQDKKAYKFYDLTVKPWDPKNVVIV